MFALSGVEAETRALSKCKLNSSYVINEFRIAAVVKLKNKLQESRWSKDQ